MSVIRHHIKNPHGHSLVKRINASTHPAVSKHNIKIYWVGGGDYPQGRITADGGVKGKVEVGKNTVRLTLRLGLVASTFSTRIDQEIVGFLSEVTSS